MIAEVHLRGALLAPPFDEPRQVRMTRELETDLWVSTEPVVWRGEWSRWSRLLRWLGLSRALYPTVFLDGFMVYVEGVFVGGYPFDDRRPVALPEGGRDVTFRLTDIRIPTEAAVAAGKPVTLTDVPVTPTQEESDDPED